MSLTFERWYPVIFSLFAVLATALLGLSLPKSEASLTGLLSASISASAILVGFIATAKSILMTLPDGGVRDRLHDSDYIHDLASYLNQSMSGNLLFCCVNIACFFPVAQAHIENVSIVWVGSATFAACSFWRVGKIMSAILKIR